MDNIALKRLGADSELFDELSALDRLCIGAEGWSAESFRSQAENENGIVICCMAEGRVIGLICGYFAADEAEILSVAVAPESRKSGIGSALMRAFESSLPDETASIFLEVRESNEAALSLYRRFGFEETAIRKNFYEKPTENAIIMKKRKRNAYFRN